MKLKSFLKAIDPEVYCKVDHVDGHNVAFSQAETIIKYNDQRFDVVGVCPENYPALNGRLGITILVDDIER